MDQPAQTFTQRRYARVPCNAAAVVTLGERRASGICDSLSVGGAFFKGEAAPARSPLKLVLCLPSMGPIEVEGEVCYSREDGIGIRFTQLPPNALMAICAYVGATLH
ncbi:MAG: PilZ domain-containing protein [Myxococcales bacterium]